VLDRKLASSCFRQFSLLVIGLAGVTYGAQLLVDAAKGIALALGVSAEIIAVTVIAVGTSLPEASVSITAIRKKLPEIALGNIIGSNIANILLILGTSALIAPLAVEFARIQTQLVFMLVAAALLTLTVSAGEKISRNDAIVFLLVFALFLASLGSA